MAGHRTSQEMADEVVERLRWGKLTGSLGLTDFDPLVYVMYHAARAFKEGRLRHKPKAREAWCEAIRMIQEDVALDHNPCLPCHKCDTAFEPVVDDKLLDLFLAWFDSFSNEALLAIHTCPACGEQIGALRTKKYKGDMHTPTPDSAKSPEHWAEILLENCVL